MKQSTNGIDFQTIGQIKGQDTTTAVSTYTFEHNTPSVGINYYRLKQMDFNGSGQQVWSGKTIGAQSLNISHLPSGLYIIRTKTGDANRFVKN